MRQVTIHVVDGQTDRDLERELLALDPRAQVHRVTGRLGRTGVRVCAHLAARYLAGEQWERTVDNLDTWWGREAAPAQVEVTALYAEPQAVVVADAPVAETAPVSAPPVAETKKAPAKKAAVKKAAPAAKTEEV